MTIPAKVETITKLRRITATVIGCGLDDVEDSSNFFSDLGGDSVGAMKLSNEARESGLKKMIIPIVYQYPVLSDMASWYDSAENEEESHVLKSEQSKSYGAASEAETDFSTVLSHWELVNDCVHRLGVTPDDIEDVYPAFPRQNAWLGMRCEIDFTVKTGSEEQVMVAIEKLFKSDPMLRTRLFEHNDTVRQVVLKEKLSWAKERGSLEDYRTRAGRHPMRIGDSMNRFVVMTEGDKTHILWTICHAISDRTSRATMVERIVKYWRNPKVAAANIHSVKPLITLLHHHGKQREGLMFWRSRLQGLRRFDHLHAPLLVAKEENITTMVREVVKSCSSFAGVTHSTICHVAWALCLAKNSKSKDIFYVTIGSGRQVPDMDLASMSGPLLCTVPFRLLSNRPEQTIKEVLEGAQKDLVAGFAYEQFGSEALKQAFGSKNYTQSILNYSGLARSPNLEFTEEREDGTKEVLNVTIPAYYGWLDPCPAICIGIQPGGKGRSMIVSRYDQDLISEEKMSSLMDGLIQNIEVLSRGDGMTVGDLWPECGEDEESKSAGYNGETLCNILGVDTNALSVIVPEGEIQQCLEQGQLRRCIQDFQTQLCKLSLPTSSIIILAVGNSLEFIISFLGATWSRYVVAPINPALKQQEIDFYAKDIDAKLMLLPRGGYSEGTAAALSAKKNGIAIAECYFDGLDVVLEIKDAPIGKSPLSNIEEAREDDVALILHTSGTTGRAKAVPLTHKNLYTSCVNVHKTYSLTSNDRTVLVMPLYHIHGIVASFLSTLLSGGTIILPPKLTPAFWTHFSDYQATWYTATPTMHYLILEFDVPAITQCPRFIRSCSSALSPTLFSRLEEKYGCPVLESYAMTEASHLMTSNPLPPGKRLPGSVGIPQNIDLEIRKENAHRVEQGEEGEVCIRGGNVTSGYLNNPAAIESSFFKDGFFRTGDQGKLDEDGYLILTGRLKEFINKGGEKISPVELDNIISQHEDVDEVVCFAMDDEVYGQDVGAAIRLKRGSEMKIGSLRKWIAERVAAHKIPRKIWTLDEIPKTSTGKVQRKMVAERLKDMQHQSEDESKASIVPVQG